MPINVCVFCQMPTRHFRLYTLTSFYNRKGTLFPAFALHMGTGCKSIDLELSILFQGTFVWPTLKPIQNQEAPAVMDMVDDGKFGLQYHCLPLF